MTDQLRALDLFGIGWLLTTASHCAAFVLGNRAYALCTNVPSAAVYTIACLTALVPIYLQLSGVHAFQRILNNLCIAAAFFLSPRWSAMEHHQSLMIMWLALLVGEMAGTHFVALLLGWLQQPSSLCRFAADAAAGCGREDEGKGEGKNKGEGEGVREGTTEGEGAGAGDCTGKRKGQASDDARGVTLTVPEMMQAYVRAHGSGLEHELRMHRLTLCFEDPVLEVLYGANALAHSWLMYRCIALAALACGLLGAALSPSFRLTGLLAASFTLLIWRAHARVAGWNDVPYAYLTFCTNYTRLVLLAGAAFNLLSLFVVVAPMDTAKSDAVGLLPPMALWERLRTPWLGLSVHARQAVGMACGAAMLLLAGVHHRLLVLPPPARMTNRVVILLSVFCSHFDPGAERLLPSAVPAFIVSACTLLAGELIGFSMDHVRRALFRDWATELCTTLSESARAARELERMRADAEELERKNAKNHAELAADKRLNHVIKGRCGSAISAFETFRQLLGPYLKTELPEEMSNLIVAPLSHLREAIEWCHRRQVFVQLEEGTYISRHTPVNLNPLIEESLIGAGTLYTNVTEPIALDETVLKIVLDELLSNALKYRRRMTPIAIEACFDGIMLHVEVRNENPLDFVPLSPDERARVFEAGYKSHLCSAMSDGLGLDSVAKAVSAAGGAVRLDQSAGSTSVHFALPAGIRTRGRLSSAPSPEEVAQLSQRALQRYDQIEASAASSGVSPKLLGKLGSASAGSMPSLSSVEVGARQCGSGSSREPSDEPSPPCTGKTSPRQHTQQVLPNSWSAAQRRCLPAPTPQVGAPRNARISSPRNLPPPRCIGLTDPLDHKSIFLSALFADQLSALDVILATGTPSECRGFIDLVLGNRDGAGGRLPAADIVVIGLSLSKAGPSGEPISGTQMAERLRVHGFDGLICVIASTDTDLEVEAACAHVAVDAVISQNARIEEVGIRLLEMHAERWARSKRLEARPQRADHVGAQLLRSVRSDVESAGDAEATTALDGAGGEANSPADEPATRCDTGSEAGVQINAPLEPQSQMSRSKAKWASPMQGRFQPPASSLPPLRRSASTIEVVSNGNPPPIPEETARASHAPGKDSLLARTTPRDDGSQSACTAPDGPPKLSGMDISSTPVPFSGLRVVGLDDETIPRMIQSLLCQHHLKADMQCSCILGANKKEMLDFVDVALGLLKPDLTFNDGEQVCADVVLLDENILPPHILGSKIALELRKRHFDGLIVLLTGASTAYVERLRNNEEIDLVFDKGYPLHKMAHRIFERLGSKLPVGRPC